MHRQEIAPGDVRYEAGEGRLHLSRRGPRAVLMRYDGCDLGRFGMEPLVDIEELVPDATDLELYIDGRAASAVSLEAARTWARWLCYRRGQLRRVVVLARRGSTVEALVEHVRASEGLHDLLVVAHRAADWPAGFLAA